jgi:murein tripeptide amidase MpaA
VKRSEAIIPAAMLLAGCMIGGARTNTGSSSSRNVVPAGAGPRTRGELTNYQETSRYADVITFLDALHGRSHLSFGSLGKSTEGRDIPYVVASRPRVSTPAEARRLARPIVYVQGNIHAGEVEGKEALLALLRDLTSSSRPNVLDSIILIAVPIYNADGNEKFAPQERNRGSQNGPQMVGERANGQGLDLNRDYVKAEAPETRGALALFNAWDPEVFVDLHTTDGSYHGYALTYAPPLNPASPLGAFTRDFVLPSLRARMQQRHGFATFDYGDFISDDTLSRGWATFGPQPRYGTNYYGLRGRISLLSEAFSHDPFQRRVASTYAFVQEILSLMAQNSETVLKLTAEARNQPSDWTKPGQVTASIPIRSEPMARPDSVEVIAEAIERTRDSVRTEPGVPRGRRRTGRFTAVRMPVYDRFRPTVVAPPPLAYALASTDTQAVRILRLHGVRVDSLQEMRRTRAERFIIDSAIISPRPFQGHREVHLVGRWMSERRELPAGTFLVPTSQPLGLISVYLLEPLSDDGLVTWNFFDNAFREGAAYPVLRVIGEPLPNSR